MPGIAKSENLGLTACCSVFWSGDTRCDSHWIQYRWVSSLLYTKKWVQGIVLNKWMYTHTFGHQLIPVADLSFIEAKFVQLFIFIQAPSRADTPEECAAISGTSWMLVQHNNSAVFGIPSIFFNCWSNKGFFLAGLRDGDIYSWMWLNMVFVVPSCVHHHVQRPIWKWDYKVEFLWLYLFQHNMQHWQALWKLQYKNPFRKSSKCFSAVEIEVNSHPIICQYWKWKFQNRLDLRLCL